MGYNGDCVGGSCSCDTGWKGTFCHELDLLPASNSSGFNQLHTSSRLSTWGGSVVWDNATQLYHMYASEITRHCGIHKWVSNSIVVHATSRGLADDWRFERKGVVASLFSHEPIVARAPSGEFVVYLSNYNSTSGGSDCPVCDCTDGSSASGGCPIECGVGRNKSIYSYFTCSSSPDGPWSPLVSLNGTQIPPAGWPVNAPCHNHSAGSPCTEARTWAAHVDMNLAPVIHQDGSVLAWTRWNIWVADDWRNASSYRDTGQAPHFDTKPYPTPFEGEDPSVWIDKAGHYHMLAHGGVRGIAHPRNDSGNCGQHYFSTTGKAGTWNTAPIIGLVGGHKMQVGGCAWPGVHVPWSDGTTKTFYRRERPHLVLGPDGFTPVALTTAVIDSPTGPGVPGFSGVQRDASYTLVQPIRQRAARDVNRDDHILI